MKKLFVPIVALATVLVVMSCKKDDTTKPEITVPDAALVIELGDREAAMKDVKATDDKDGDVAKDVKVEGLDFVGVGNLTYSVKDQAGNESEQVKRKVTINSGKLGGTYLCKEIDRDDATENSFTSVMSPDASDATKLVVTNLRDEGILVSFVGNGTSTDLAMISIPINVIDNSVTYPATISGSAKYKSSSAGYEVYELSYEIKFDDTSIDNWRYITTATKKTN